MTPGDARRVTRLVREQYELVLAGDVVAVRDAMAAVRDEDLVLVLGATVVVAAHALDAVDQLGGDKDQVAEQGIDLAHEAMMTAVASSG